MVNALGWILGAEMVEEVEEEEHQDQSLEGEFPKEAWKWVAGEHQLQEVPADVVGPRKKTENEGTYLATLPPTVCRDKENTLLRKEKKESLNCAYYVSTLIR